MKIVYLKPLSSFTGQMRSDTIWGLLCWGIRNIYGEEGVKKFIESHLDGTSVVKVSSAFRYYGTGAEGDKAEITLLFPKPQLPTFTWAKITAGKSKAQKLETYASLKKYKKKKYLTKTELEDVLTGKLNDEDLFFDFIKNLKPGGSALQHSKSDYECTKEKEEKGKARSLPNANYFQEEPVMHNAIDRLSGTVLEGALFATEEIYTASNAGLFFLIDCPESVFSHVEAALRYLGHSGFGGDATTGKNQFSPVIEDFNLKLPEKAEQFTTLSLYAPKKDETAFYSSNEEKCFYENVIRKGKAGGKYYQASEFWKKSVFSFAEGSVFPSLGKDIYGSVEVVLPQSNKGLPFDVYHSGVAFSLPIKLKGIS